MELVPGTHVGRFEVVAPLAADGVAPRWRAVDLETDGEVDLIEVPRGVTGVAERIADLVAAQAPLDHPNLAPLREVVAAGDDLLVATEVVDGPALTEVLDGEPLPRRDVPPIFDQLCEAAEMLHHHGVLHGGIGPDVVVLRVTPHGISACLTEPGLADVLGRAGSRPSPEQLGGAHVDARSDVFSLGCVLFELLAGAPPFVGDDARAVARAITEGARRPLATLAPDLPARLVAAVERALAVNPARRFDSVELLRVEVAEAARPLLGLDAPATAADPRQREVISLPTTPDPVRPVDPPARAPTPAPPREVISLPSTPDPVRPVDPPARAPAPPREVIAPPPGAVADVAPPPPVAAPPEPPPVPDEPPPAAPELPVEALRAPEPDGPSGLGFGVWFAAFAVVALLAGGVGAFTVGGAADTIAAADADARAAARAVRVAQPPPPLAQALGRAAPTLDGPRAALEGATTVGERARLGRDYVRLVRAELVRQQQAGLLTTGDLAQAGGQVEPLDRAVSAAEAALDVAEAQRTGWGFDAAQAIGWVEAPRAADLALTRAE